MPLHYHMFVLVLLFPLIKSLDGDTEDCHITTWHPQRPVITTCGYCLGVKSLLSQASLELCQRNAQMGTAPSLEHHWGSHTPSPFLATFPSWICSCPWASAASSPALLRVVSEPRTDRNGHRGPKHPQNTALVYKPEAFTCCFKVVWAKLKTPVALSYWWRAAYFQ